MKATLSLHSPAWRCHGATHVSGQAFSKDGKAQRADALAAILDACPDALTWQTIIAGLNGNFAAVTARPSLLIAAVDRVRSVPLFYSICENSVTLADDAYAARAQLPASALDTLAAREFELTGYVTGRETLVAGLYQVRAGHLLKIADTESIRPEQIAYYAFRHGNFTTRTVEQLASDLVDVHRRVFARLAADAADRPLVVPLSGGYDSRLIGVALKELGIRNVLCYTYGVAGNWEARISEELARHLGFKWTMIPYTAHRWREWSGTPEFREYFRSAGNLVSVPHIQDWPAVFEMKQAGLLAPDSVFLPGHTGDFVVGGHVPKVFIGKSRIHKEELLETILRIHYSLWDWPKQDRFAIRAAIRHRIEEVIGPLAIDTPEEAADAFEFWEWQERQAKFICNSVRVYEFFGYQWRLPLFDSELMDFWSNVPVELRVGRKLYLEFVRRHQKLPITPANTDYALPTRVTLRALSALGLHPLAKQIQHLGRRLTWQRQYERGNLAWLALVDPNEFRDRYTGREIGHSFFALRYLATVGR